MRVASLLLMIMRLSLKIGVRVPDGVPMDIAALFGCAVLTGAGIITNTVQPAKGSTVAIFGLEVWAAQDLLCMIVQRSLL